MGKKLDVGYGYLVDLNSFFLPAIVFTIQAQRNIQNSVCTWTVEKNSDPLLFFTDLPQFPRNGQSCNTFDKNGFLAEFC